MLEKWTNTSSPDSREMKPKPFSALKNFTVPVVTFSASLLCKDRSVDRWPPPYGARAVPPPSEGSDDVQLEPPCHPQQRRPDADHRVRRLPDPARRDGAGGGRRPRCRLPTHRHRRRL